MFFVSIAASRTTKRRISVKNAENRSGKEAGWSGRRLNPHHSRESRSLKNALPMGRHCRSADLIDCRI